MKIASNTLKQTRVGASWIADIRLFESFRNDDGVEKSGDSADGCSMILAMAVADAGDKKGR